MLKRDQLRFALWIHVAKLVRLREGKKMDSQEKENSLKMNIAKKTGLLKKPTSFLTVGKVDKNEIQANGSDESS